MQYRITVLFILLGLLGFAQERDSVYTEPIVKFPDVEAEFPGGYTALSQFILGKLNFDSTMIDLDHLDTRMDMAFIVASDGTTHSFEITNEMLTPFGKKKVLEILQQMPNWNPGKLENKPVATLVTMPLQIHLN